MAPRRKEARPGLSSKQEEEEDEASTVKQELNKCYKRIADLETRIHDLTLQMSVVSVSYILHYKPVT